MVKLEITNREIKETHTYLKVYKNRNECPTFNISHVQKKSYSSPNTEQNEADRY